MLGGRAEVDRVDEEALVAAIEVQGEPGDGGIGDGVEGGAELAVDRFDKADEVDVDLALELGDDIGEFSFAAVGAQIDRAFEGLFKQRGFGLGEAEQGSRRALIGGELDSGAGALDVGVVEELGVGKGDRDAGDVGVGSALGVGEFCVKRRVTGVIGGTGDASGELGGEGEGAAVGDLVVDARGGDARPGCRRFRR